MLRHAMLSCTAQNSFSDAQGVHLSPADCSPGASKACDRDEPGLAEAKMGGHLNLDIWWDCADFDLFSGFVLQKVSVWSDASRSFESQMELCERGCC